MMKTCCGLLLLYWLFVSCTQKPAPAEENKPAQASAPLEQPPVEQPQEPATSRPKAIVLDSYSEFPEEVEGCSCYFSRNKQEFAAGKYIYMNNYANLAFVSIGGQLVRLECIDKSDSVKTDAPYRDASVKYELRAIVKKSSPSGEEVFKTEGVLLVKDLKTGASSEIPFVGECGC